MPSSNTDVEGLDGMIKEAFAFWLGIFDDISGGAFAKGYRPPLAVERVREWDSLTPEQLTKLQDIKGAEWIAQYGGEIERLRKGMPEFPAPPQQGGGHQ